MQERRSIEMPCERPCRRKLPQWPGVGSTEGGTAVRQCQHFLKEITRRQSTSPAKCHNNHWMQIPLLCFNSTLIQVPNTAMQTVTTLSLTHFLAKIMMSMMLLSLCLAPAHSEDDCQLIPGRVTIVKETNVDWNGRSVSASCTADVILSKCEGTCESSVSPSVRQPRGFRRDCRCCKEGVLRQRPVTLNECYHDGQLIPGAQQTIEVSEIQSCDCYSCTN